MKYFVFEIQKLADGAYAHLVHEADNRNEAESKFYQVLAAAAISNIPEHSAIMFTGEGFPLMHQGYKHDPQPEELPEEELAE